MNLHLILVINIKAKNQDQTSLNCSVLFARLVGAFVGLWDFVMVEVLRFGQFNVLCWICDFFDFIFCFSCLDYFVWIRYDSLLMAD